MLESVFNKVKAYNFIKKRLQHRRFPLNISKFLRTPFFYRTHLVAASVSFRGLNIARKICLTVLLMTFYFLLHENITYHLAYLFRISKFTAPPLAFLNPHRFLHRKIDLE